MRDELGLSDSEEEEDKEDTSRDTSKKTDSRGPVFVSSSHSKKNENPIETEGDNDGEESQGNLSLSLPVSLFGSLICFRIFDLIMPLFRYLLSFSSFSCFFPNIFI